MVDHPRDGPEQAAEAILRAPEFELHAYVRRGIMERWLSGLIHDLNSLERQPRTRDLARRALRRLGFPTSA